MFSFPREDCLNTESVFSELGFLLALGSELIAASRVVLLSAQALGTAVLAAWELLVATKAPTLGLRCLCDVCSEAKDFTGPCCVGCFKGASEPVQVLLNGIEAVYMY